VVAVLVACAAMALSGCTAPSDDVVARIDDRDIGVDEVRAYLEANLGDEWGEEALQGEERDLVRSRLFDAYLEERLLLHEADRLGIEVGDDEIDAYLRGVSSVGRAEFDAPAAEETSAGPSAVADRDPVRRDVARRTLRIQTLIDRSVHRAADVDDREVDAWLRQIGGEDASVAGTVELRSLLMPSVEAAQRTYREIRRRRMTFDEAVALYEPTPGQSAPSELPLAGLPEAVREAISDVKPGRVSGPIELYGDTFLFQVVRRGVDDEDLEAERARARRELQDHRYLQASRRLLEELRERVRVRVFPENLPFRYVPDEGDAAMSSPWRSPTLARYNDGFHGARENRT
jgi:hypothetical protein